MLWKFSVFSIRVTNIFRKMYVTRRKFYQAFLFSMHSHFGLLFLNPLLIRKLVSFRETCNSTFLTLFHFLNKENLWANFFILKARSLIVGWWERNSQETFFFKKLYKEFKFRKKQKKESFDRTSSSLPGAFIFGRAVCSSTRIRAQLRRITFIMQISRRCRKIPCFPG